MTRIVVTGAAGFIGSNIIAGLNARGMTDIIAVDDLKQGDKFRNLADSEIADYLDKDDFLDRFARGEFGKVRAVLHASTHKGFKCIRSKTCSPAKPQANISATFNTWPLGAKGCATAKADRSTY